jgi:hypothetical protein
MRKVLPILTMMAALLGCTTNRTPGNGQPVTEQPYFNPANTYGTSSGNVPMTSSYLVPSTSDADRAAYAAEVMRERQLFQPRFLGYLTPEPRVAQQPAQDYVTGQFINPSMTANPELTVNSSISSEPFPVITGGAAVDTGTGAFVVPGGSGSGTAAVATTGTTAAATVGTTIGATNAATSSTTGAATRVGTSTAVTVGPATANAITANGRATLTPTISSGSLPSPLAVSGVTTAITPAGMASATATTPSTTGMVAPLTVNRTTGATTSALTAGSARAGSVRLTLPTTSGVTVPLTVTTTPGGQIMITNVRR